MRLKPNRALHIHWVADHVPPFLTWITSKRYATKPLPCRVAGIEASL